MRAFKLLIYFVKMYEKIIVVDPHWFNAYPDPLIKYLKIVTFS
jgi:hypothetical protein